MKSKLRLAGIVVLVLAVVAVLVLAIAKVQIDKTYFDGYQAAAPLGLRVVEERETEDYLRYHFYYKGCNSEEVPALLAMPKEHKGPVPCVIFLHGIGQGKDFLDDVAAPFVKAGFAFASFDQYSRGERKDKSLPLLQKFREFRLRPAYTVNDTRRMIDYLESRRDIATNRVYLLGASYGAITGATVAAFDDRIKAAVLVYGGADYNKLLQAPAVKEGAGIWMPLARVAMWYVFGVADPVRYAGQIAPRPVFLQNGTEDSLISTEAAKALQDAVQEPKEIKWYEGDHVGLDEATTKTVLEDALNYLLKVDGDVVLS